MQISWAESVFDLFFPKTCLSCNRPIENKYLCTACLSLCKPCTNHENSAHGIFFYETTIRDLIIKAKFAYSEQAALILTDLIKEQILNNDMAIREIAQFNPSAIAYIPTHWLRSSLRGFDLPHLFALTLSKRLNIPITHTLKTNGLKVRQSSLKKSMREHAIKGAFKITSQQIFFKRLLVVDDIITTGATFDEARSILRNISKEIRCLAIAKTP